VAQKTHIVQKALHYTGHQVTLCKLLVPRKGELGSLLLVEPEKSTCRGCRQRAGLAPQPEPPAPRTVWSRLLEPDSF
jgi:hypothetical protein